MKMKATRHNPTLSSVLLLGLFFSLLCTSASAQERCEIKLPLEKAWNGSADLGDQGTTPGSVAITEEGRNQFQITDFSGGFLGKYGFEGDHPVVIRIRCNGSIEPITMETDFGPCKITGGKWNARRGSITLEWEIPESRIVQTSTFIAK